MDTNQVMDTEAFDASAVSVSAAELAVPAAELRTACNELSASLGQIQADSAQAELLLASLRQHEAQLAASRTRAENKTTANARDLVAHLDAVALPMVRKEIAETAEDLAWYRQDAERLSKMRAIYAAELSLRAA